MYYKEGDGCLRTLSKEVNLWLKYKVETGTERRKAFQMNGNKTYPATLWQELQDSRVASES